MCVCEESVVVKDEKASVARHRVGGPQSLARSLFTTAKVGVRDTRVSSPGDVGAFAYRVRCLAASASRRLKAIRFSTVAYRVHLETLAPTSSVVHALGRGVHHQSVEMRRYTHLARDDTLTDTSSSVSRQ